MTVQTSQDEFRKALVDASRENMGSPALWCTYGISPTFMRGLAPDIRCFTHDMGLRILVGTGTIRDCGHGGTWYMIGT